jgi:Na+-translocating ferredoxin:NAD+ oxidoreductase RnfE subunit
MPEIKKGFWIGLGVALAIFVFGLIQAFIGRGLGKVTGGGGGG